MLRTIEKGYIKLKIPTRHSPRTMHGHAQPKAYAK